MLSVLSQQKHILEFESHLPCIQDLTSGKSPWELLNSFPEWDFNLIPSYVTFKWHYLLERSPNWSWNMTPALFPVNKTVKYRDWAKKGLFLPSLSEHRFSQNGWKMRWRTPLTKQTAAVWPALPELPALPNVSRCCHLVSPSAGGSGAAGSTRPPGTGAPAGPGPSPQLLRATLLKPPRKKKRELVRK